MKQIEPISIWDNGIVQEALVLNTCVTNLQLNKSATFWWGLYNSIEGNIGVTLSQGNLVMDADDYQLWDADEFAWEFVAGKLSLIITGDYVKPDPVIEKEII